MAEYNFWDYRTHECNNDYYCPVINSYCLTQECEECNDYKDFCKFYSQFSVCKRCGAPHDDGNADYCMNCLDKQFNEAVDEAFIEELIEQGVSC